MEARTSAEGGSRWAKIAYDAIAPVYDDFTAHHEYDVWLGQLMPKVERHGLRGKRLLDVACGTGKSFIPLLEEGWEVTACDISPEMVELARAKVGDKVELHVADMRTLPKFGEFDLVFCLDDAVNYLLSSEELVEALSAMAANLAPEGLLMFDVNAMTTYRTFFSEEVVVERDGRRLTWRGRSTPEAEQGSINEAVFEIESLEEGAEPIEPVVHRQRHFPEAVVLAALEQAGLECVDLFGHREDAIPEQPLREDFHTKAVYISRLAPDL